MKSHIFIITLLFLFSGVQADELESQIDVLCLKQAGSLVNKFKIESKLDDTQSNRLLKMSTESCKASFKNELSNENIEVVEKEKSSDWLTDNIMDGEVNRKEGNKRLMRKR